MEISMGFGMVRTGSVFRHSGWDALLVALSVVHAAAVCAWPSAPLIALGLWWNSNSVSHNFVHAPFFTSPLLNRTYSAFLSILLGFPQTVWRARHLAHHRGGPIAWPSFRESGVECVAITGMWVALCMFAAPFFFLVYLPGYFAGLGLCLLHGHYEHNRGTRSYYGRLYNLAFLNDGYHAEHHAEPEGHWTNLPKRRSSDSPCSAWPAVLRWAGAVDLELLERAVLCSPALQRFLLRTHERAIRTLLKGLPAPETIVVVGGGMFPRTALILRKLMPDADMVVMDSSAANLRAADPFLDGHVTLVHAKYRSGALDGAQLAVIPLGFDGDRERIYEQPPAALTLVHDWIWSPRGKTVVVSPFLLKRLNLLIR